MRRRAHEAAHNGRGMARAQPVLLRRRTACRAGAGYTERSEHVDGLTPTGDPFDEALFLGCAARSNNAIDRETGDFRDALILQAVAKPRTLIVQRGQDAGNVRRELRAHLEHSLRH